MLNVVDRNGDGVISFSGKASFNSPRQKSGHKKTFKTSLFKDQSRLLPYKMNISLQNSAVWWEPTLSFYNKERESTEGLFLLIFNISIPNYS